MSQNSPKKDSLYRKRRKKVIQALGASIAVIPSAPKRLYSRDQAHAYRHDSNLYYLTGIREDNACLLIFGKKKPKSILYLEDVDPVKTVWEGSKLGLRKARRRLSVDDIRPIELLEKEFKELCKGTEEIHYSFGSCPRCDSLVQKVVSNPTLPNFELPHSVIDIREILSEMRLYKDAQEISALRRASDITARGLIDLAPLLDQMANEKQCALHLESLFAKYGAESTSFSTIVAAGKNATTLHHAPSFSPIWKRDCVLIDSGASFNGYAGDITRVFPVSGTFSEAQATIYDAVLEAVNAGIKAADAGKSLEDIHASTCLSISKSLSDIGLCKGSAKEVYKSGAYKEFFMHRTGHWLGLDVHDTAPAQIGAFRAPSYLLPLKPGMAFTIEPGIYIDAKNQNVPKEFRGIGIRLEQDILINSQGKVEILSHRVPIERTDIEALIRR